MSKQKYFMGIPVEGKVNKRNAYRKEQKTISYLKDEFVGIFEDPNVLAIRWKQYTPYFNDGEPCEFGVYGFEILLNSVRLKALEVYGDNAYSGYGEYEDNFLEAWDINYSFELDGELHGVMISESTKHRISVLESNLNSYEDVLEEEFGDNAQITLTREKVAIDYYAHD